MRSRILAVISSNIGLVTLLPFCEVLAARATAAPNYESKGWTEESTNSTEPGPWLQYDPPGTRYWRDYKNIIYRVYPPGVKPNAAPANSFGLNDSSETIPPYGPALPTEPNTNSVSVPTLGLSLSIPRDWREVPTFTLEQVTKELRQRAPNTKVDQPSTAFQKPPLVSGELSYPYILVYSRSSRSLAKADLRALSTQAASRQVADKTKKDTGGFINPSSRSMIFDESDLRARGAFASNIGGVGSVATYIEIIPSTGGAITLSGYLLGATPAAAQEFYRPIFDSARLDAAHAYSPPEETPLLEQPFDWSKLISAAIMGALMAAIFGRKKK